MKESSRGTVYTVIIEAEVYEEKIESAFSSRVSRFVAENIIGPCNLMVVLTKMSASENISVGIICGVNDPTIDMSTISIRLPESDGREKSEV